MTDTQPPLAFLLSTEFANKYPHKLVAQFPHVAQRLDALWNDGAALADYFTELLVSSRPGRSGFPPEVGAEILSLSLAYDRIGAIKPQSANPTVAKPFSGTLWEYERAIAELDRLGIARTVAAFVRAAEAGDEHVCMLFISAGFSVDMRDPRQWTPLMIACFNGREALALELIRLGASINAEDADGYTPLHWAAFNGYQNVVKLLLRKGASANLTSHAGITPMLQAAARGHLNVVAQLLANRGNPNLIAKDGSSPLLKAVANGHFNVVRLLLEAGASTDARMTNGSTLSQIAEQARDPRIREAIAEAIRAPRASGFSAYGHETP